MSDNPQTNAEELARQIMAFTDRSQRAMQAFWQRQIEERTENAFNLIEPSAVTKAFIEFSAKLMTDPGRLAEAQVLFWQMQFDLWHRMMLRVQGEEVEPAYQPERGDRRFRDKSWDDDLLFDYLKQSYLLCSKWMRDVVDDVEDRDSEQHQRVVFYTRQFLSAMAPTNFALTNPTVLKKAEETGGQNLIDGLEHLLADLEDGKGRFKISMVDQDAFEVGRNVAATKGDVIFQTEMMQLIQYAPTTEAVYKRPLLLVPPWINKFYILDLQSTNSFIQHAVDQGHTVFVMSWINPSRSLAKKTFDDYLRDGTLAALDAIKKATGEQDVNILGFCIGGILTATTLAYLAAKGEADRVHSTTFLTTMFDFKDVGEARVFIDDEQIAQMEQHIAKRGYLEAYHMADMFSMMRENDLIWSFVVNNYLMGREPMAFDLLYWNADSTRMPAAMLIYYLKEFYQRNRLREPGGLTLGGMPLNVADIKTPAYIMAAKDDHIAPWQSCYPGVQLLSGPKKFVLTASGHVAGVINPPTSNKYGYWTHNRHPKEADQWLSSADWQDGSWWPDWHQWLARKAGKKVPARPVGEGALKSIEPAPGSYVKMRVQD